MRDCISFRARVRKQSPTSPGQKWEHEASADIASLAAAYAFGFARNHGFRDGNKRIAFMTMATFLSINGYEFETTDEDVVATIIALADGTRTETQLAGWVRTHLRRRSLAP